MKRIMGSLVLLTSLVFLGGCQKVSKDEMSQFFDKDLLKLVENYTSVHGTAGLNSIDVDFDGKRIEMTIQGRDTEKEYEMIIEPLKNDVLKDKSEKLDREDKIENEATISDIKKLKSLKEMKSAFVAEKIDPEAIESMELGNELNKNVWEVQVYQGKKEMTYYFDGMTAELLQTEID